MHQVVHVPGAPPVPLDVSFWQDEVVFQVGFFDILFQCSYTGGNRHPDLQDPIYTTMSGSH